MHYLTLSILHSVLLNNEQDYYAKRILWTRIGVYMGYVSLQYSRTHQQRLRLLGISPGCELLVYACGSQPIGTLPVARKIPRENYRGLFLRIRWLELYPPYFLPRNNEVYIAREIKIDLIN